MKQVLEGSHAVAEAVRLANVRVISAYPITPQTHIVEALSGYCSDGSMDARFLCVESEHSAMAAVIAAALGGVRTFTATSSHGLALMHELLHWAAGARLPIVMAEVNRALGPGWNIWTDQTDSLAQRDTGWIQMYCEDGQEVLDTTLQAFRLAETVNLPVMVIMDAFFLSHTLEPVDVPDRGQVDAFLPPFNPRFAMDLSESANFGQLAPPNIYMEMRRNMELAMEQVPACMDRIEMDFETIFDRRHGVVEAVRCEDAEIVLVTSGTITSTCRQVIEALRAGGEKAGLLKLKMFRPFPGQIIRDRLGSVSKVAVVDRNFSFGSGGIFAQELRAAFCNAGSQPEVFSYIAGLGGRDVTPDTLTRIYRMARDSRGEPGGCVWVDVNEAEAGVPC